MKQKFKKVLAKRPRRRSPVETVEQAIRGIPRITNETVAEHREEVLSSARKYIYPLQHSVSKVVTISGALTIAVVVTFFTYSLLSLYRFNSTSTFIYRVTQVMPFPVAKAGPYWVSYESYLFELRHYMHYYQTQQKVDFSSESGKRQLADYRKQALDTVITDAYVKQLAKENKVSVSAKEVNDQIEIIRAQNRLGDNPKVFADVLKQFWGWSTDDFKRELAQQLLAEKVVSKLDTGAHQKAQNILTQLQSGGNFADLAKTQSDDKSTSVSGGDYGIDITPTTREIPAAVVSQLFKMKAGEVSPIVDTGNGLEILLVRDNSGTVVHASHISVQFAPLSTYTQPLMQKEKAHKYISV